MARLELAQVTQIGTIGAETRRALVIPVYDLTVITLTQRIFERSGNVADHLALQTAASDAADALGCPLPAGTWPGRRCRAPLSRQCRTGLPRPWALANALRQPAASALP